VAAGVVVGVIGVDAIRQVRRPRDMAVASLPAVFAAHQLIEALVWLDLTGRAPATVGRVALWLYMLIAYVVLPVFVPAAVLAVETDAARRRWVARLTVVGGAVAAVYLVAMVHGPIGVAIDGHSLNYDTGVSAGGPLAAVYVAACCGSLLASSNRSVVMFGLANALVVAFLMWMSTQELTSLWCFWAAIASMAIAVHLRSTSGAGGAGPLGATPPEQSSRGWSLLGRE